MSKRISVVILLVILVACFMSGCAKSSNDPHETESVLESSTVTISETESQKEDKSSANESSDDTSSEPVTENATNAVTDKAPAEQTTEKNTAPVETNPPKTDTKTNPPVSERTDPVVIEPSRSIHASSLTLSFADYESANEKAPFVKGSPIYGILYSGDRAQVGDKLKFSLSASPANHTDRITIEASKGLEYSLSGGVLTVRIKSDDNYGAGRITIYALAENGVISASANYLFSIDPASDPFSDMSGILGDYIGSCGMNFSPVAQGYTASDPSLSITKYDGAPAWDDIIDKTNPDWISRCFRLIDQYKALGYNKVNFIITETSVGFSASK